MTGSAPKYFTMTVPWDASTVTIGLMGGEGNVNLYVNNESNAWPTSAAADLSSTNAGTSQSVQFTANAGQQIMLQLDGQFTGVTFHALVQSNEQGGGNTDPTPTDPNDPFVNNHPELNDGLPEDESRFLGLDGQALVERIMASNPQHVGAVFNIKSGQARYLFSESNMMSVISELRRQARTIDEYNAYKVQGLIYFLRGGLFVQFFNPELVPAYSSSIEVNLKAAMQDLFASAGIYGESNDQALALQELLTLTDSAEIRAPFYDNYINILEMFDETWAVKRSRMAAANAMMTAFFRASQAAPNGDADFIARMQDGRLLDTMYRFQRDNRYLLQADDNYFIKNVVNELARFLSVPSLKDQVKPMVKNILASTSQYDETAPLWVKAGSMADTFDRQDCGYYDICGFAYYLEKETLKFNYQCSDTLKIRAQQMYNDQAQWICEVLGQQEAHFHTVLKTYNIPVADDYNDALELVIFNSSEDYRDYAGTFFNMDTNNGGMYLEGAPNDPNNQARFIAYEQNGDDYFHVWNLQHEYVHYLDGRFDLYGDFAQGLTAATTWWTEGLGEYIAYQDGYNHAINVGQAGNVALSTIFTNTYESGQDRIYRWGYLAVRFMHERHSSDVAQILTYLRSGEYQAYQQYIDDIGTRYDNEFANWVASLAEGVSGIVERGPDDSVAVNSGDTGNWAGEPETIDTDFTPCMATDAANAFDPSNNQLSKGVTVVECISPSTSSANFVFSNSGSEPLTLRITTEGGWGNLDILYKGGNWPTRSDYTAKSGGHGNTESIDLQIDANEHWHYFSLDGQFGGAKMTVEIVE